MTTRNRGGRPTKINKDIIERIVKVVEAGNYIETAAAYVGISKTTLYDWMKRGAREADRLESDPTAKPNRTEKLFVEFSNALTRAMATAEIRDVERLNEAAKAGEWRAALEKLKRRHPERWGNKDRLQAEIENKGNVGLNIVISYGDEGDEDG